MPALRRLGRIVAVPAALAALMTSMTAAAPGAAAQSANYQSIDAPAYVVFPGHTLHPKPPSWELPVADYELTGRFGQSSSMWSSTHTGLDFAAPTGTPIRAISDGVVTETAYDDAYGNRTIVRLPDGTTLWFCHQDEFGVEVGQHVKAGQRIGYVGATGNVTGPHVHLEVHPGGGDAVDPAPWLQDHGLQP